MRISRNVSGPFITGPDYNNEDEGFSLRDMLILTAVIGSIAGSLYGISCIDKYFNNPKRNNAHADLEKQINLDFQKYDQNKDGVLNYKEFVEYYRCK